MAKEGPMGARRRHGCHEGRWEAGDELVMNWPDETIPAGLERDGQGSDLHERDGRERPNARQHLHTAEVTGSSPVTPTGEPRVRRPADEPGQ